MISTSGLDIYMAVMLVPLYLIAAGLRLYAALRNRALRWWYIASIPLALAVAGLYVWAAFGANDPLRATVARAMSFPTAILVWIWPALLAARDER